MTADADKDAENAAEQVAEAGADRVGEPEPGAQRARHLDDLNSLFAEEVEAIIRYLHLAVTLKGIDRLHVRAKMLAGLEETLEHATQIGERIVQMGGAPSLDIKLQLTAEKVSGREAIESALAFEQAALDAYVEALDRCADDIVHEEFLRGQIATESRHVTELSLLLED